MENEMNQDDKVELIIMNAKYFKLDFPNQNIEGNSLFVKFKKKQLEELGNNSKLFHCSIDNIYFYESKNVCETSTYYIKCPLCNNYICYFCQRVSPKYAYRREICCIKFKLFYLFTKLAFEYINNYENLSPIRKKDFKIVLVVFFIPFLFLLIVFLEVNYLLHFDIVLKNMKYNKEYALGTYYQYYEKKKPFTILFPLALITSFFYSICYTIYSIYFNILILFISLFTKFYPFKYCIGILVFGV